MDAAWPMATPNNTRVRVSCGHCGRLFSTTNYRLSCGRGKYCCRRCAYDAITARTTNRKAGRMRAKRAYPEIADCERCGGRPATDRHHVDGNTFNNLRSNVLFVCRRCHMELDGRLRLTREDIAFIRATHVPGKHGSRVELAARFGVGPDHISSIVSGRKGGGLRQSRPCSVAGSGCINRAHCRTTCSECHRAVCGGCSVRRGHGGMKRLCLLCHHQQTERP